MAALGQVGTNVTLEPAERLCQVTPVGAHDVVMTKSLDVYSLSQIRARARRTPTSSTRPAIDGSYVEERP